MKKDEEPKVWVTALKLIVGAAAFIGMIGWTLWYLDKHQDPMPIPESKNNWGIAGDNPVRPRK